MRLLAFGLWQDKCVTQCPLSFNSVCRMLTASFILLEKECPQVWMRLPPSRSSKHWDVSQDPVIPPMRGLYGNPVADYSGNSTQQRSELGEKRHT